MEHIEEIFTLVFAEAGVIGVLSVIMALILLIGIFALAVLIWYGVVPAVRVWSNLDKTLQEHAKDRHAAIEADRLQTQAITNLRDVVNTQTVSIADLDTHTGDSLKAVTEKIEGVAEAVENQHAQTRQELGSQLHDIADSLKRFDATLSQNIQEIAAKLEAVAVQIEPVNTQLTALAARLPQSRHVLIEADTPEDNAA